MKKLILLLLIVGCGVLEEQDCAGIWGGDAELDNCNVCDSDKTLLFETFKSDRQKKNCVKTMQANFTKDFVHKNNINLHTFRHTYAHNMLNKGVPKEVLQTLLGHRSIKTTEIYANWVRKEELERWV